MMKTKRFLHERTALDYRLTLEARKTISVTVFPDQTVTVLAPLNAEESKIHEFLKRKLPWILKQRRYFAQFKTRTSREYISGETVRYLGRNYKLLVRKTEEQERVSLQSGTLTVLSHSPQDRIHTREMLDSWYAEKANRHFIDRLRHCSQQFGQKNPPALSIRRMTRRWGSYSRKTHRIWLNRELIKASRTQIDYVLTHELCHVTHLAHDRAFYNLLARHIPDWRGIKEKLELTLTWDQG